MKSRARDHPAARSKVPVTSSSRDVWFAYDVGHVAKVSSDIPASPEWVLRGVSFIAEPGRTLALVGHTGAGKTTIVNLLMRFYDPQRGRILVNGTDIREMHARRASRTDRLRAAGHFPFCGRCRDQHQAGESADRRRSRRGGIAEWVRTGSSGGCPMGTAISSASADRRSASVSGSFSRSRGRSRRTRRFSSWTRRRAQWTARSRRRFSGRWRCSWRDGRQLRSPTVSAL